MYDETSKPSWNTTFWALIGFALMVGVVLLVGAENTDIVATTATPLS